LYSENSPNTSVRAASAASISFSDCSSVTSRVCQAIAETTRALTLPAMCSAATVGSR